MADRVAIFDTTLRDGEQSPGFSMTLEEKVAMARALAELQVDVIEAGFPASSPGDGAAVAAVARAVRGPVIAALARAAPEDIDAAAEALRGAKRPRIHTFIATSEVHMRSKLRKTPHEVVADAAAAVRRARRYAPEVEFSAEDASRSDPDFLIRVFAAAVAAGATTINIPDTVGYATPDQFAALVRRVRAEVPGIDGVTVSVHCHDDLGLAVANSLAAVQAGARQVECTVNGIGERAGNAALEEVVMALVVRRDVFGVEVGVRTQGIYGASRTLEAITGVAVPPNKAIVGANAFAHEAGIHQHGVIVNPLTYEIMRPEDVGVPATRLVMGKHSGRHAFAHVLAQQGVHLPEEALERAFAAFKALADRRKRVTVEELVALAREVHSAAGGVRS
ncbi:MAG: 2-isopropylmalate synthase [Armatimonadota bacterium]|nr:2-isopropylmalate synthase [Armatimonadota bacterium]MDR7463770.1 2-isopropylmalate synthase [Armatimonadota bacterium]MDR7470344.1 2-isopropylmalate synthase [Armatimonadota bacterium]MDR7475236.1 2-isopropylmalate synthase [Armatimonadota bacterium]MDR7539550.1 2-isopropylmalate synthase [Armatimonadota bacterium]